METRASEVDSTTHCHAISQGEVYVISWSLAGCLDDLPLCRNHNRATGRIRRIARFYKRDVAPYKATQCFCVQSLEKTAECWNIELVNFLQRG
jgi:hypothetical protein